MRLRIDSGVVIVIEIALPVLSQLKDGAKIEFGYNGLPVRSRKLVFWKQLRIIRENMCDFGFPLFDCFVLQKIGQRVEITIDLASWRGSTENRSGRRPANYLETFER